jgi:hypothetical protein
MRLASALRAKSTLDRACPSSVHPVSNRRQRQGRRLNLTFFDRRAPANLNQSRRVLAAAFRNETINGFAASGASPDTIQPATSSFSYLTAGMTQTQDVAALLAQAVGGLFA